MAGNTFGQLFTVTSFGESHGPALGCVVDGCPPGLALSESDIQPDVDRRRSGTSQFTSQRREGDQVRILSGVFEGLTTGTPIGRKVRAKVLTKAAPVVRAKPGDLLAAGVERVPRVAGARDGLPELADGRTLDVANVVWCTGFTPGFDWIDLPIMDDGYPRQVRGVVDEVPGLYFCGLFFQHSLWSETFPGMPRDVRYVMDHLERRQPASAGTASEAFH